MQNARAMKLSAIPHWLLAVALALCPLLERPSCADMGSPGPTVPAVAPATGGHACCCRPGETPAGAVHSCSMKAPPRCLCPMSAPAARTLLSVPRNEAPSQTPLAPHPVVSIVPPPRIETAAVAALDEGSPPGPDDPRAHGQRAPPLPV
jgi:hypothetical protein